MKLVGRLFAIVLLSLVYTGASVADAGWSGVATITSLYSVNENQVLVKMSSFANPHNCSVNYGGDIIVDPTTQKSLFSMLMSAYIAGKTVDIYVSNECITIWGGTSYAKAYHARLL